VSPIERRKPPLGVDPATAPPGAIVPMVPGTRSLVRLTLRPLLTLWLRLRVEGVEHVPADGPVLIASTHQSHADSLAIGVAVRRPVHFLGDLKLTTWPVLGPQLPKLGMIPLRRGEADDAAMTVLHQLLQQGACVAVYPEGSRSRDGRVHRLRSGVARLAADGQVPVVPAAVAGIYDVWPIGQNPRVLGGKVTVRFGAPMAAPADSPRARREFNDRLQLTLAALGRTEAADDFSPFHGGEDNPDPKAAS
jgi:1-acyl-sn-glycerol-3-phosphate acyltransferase